MTNPLSPPNGERGAFDTLLTQHLAPGLMPVAHSHGHIEMNWLTAGDVTYRIDGQEVVLPPRRLVIFWANTPHQVIELDTAGGTASQWNNNLPLDEFLLLRGIDRLQECLLAGAVVAMPDGFVDEATLSRLQTYYDSGDERQISILELEIYLLFRRMVLEPWTFLLDHSDGEAGPRAHEHDERKTRRVIAMVRFVLANLSHPISNAEVARAADLGVDYAHELFRRVMRVSTGKFITRMRLLQARSQLLETDLSIESVAFDSGFASLTQFYFHFKKFYGMPPAEFRSRWHQHTPARSGNSEFKI